MIHQSKSSPESLFFPLLSKQEMPIFGGREDASSSPLQPDWLWVTDWLQRPTCFLLCPQAHQAYRLAAVTFTLWGRRPAATRPVDSKQCWTWWWGHVTGGMNMKKPGLQFHYQEPLKSVTLISLSVTIRPCCTATGVTVTPCPFHNLPSQWLSSQSPFSPHFHYIPSLFI